MSLQISQVGNRTNVRQVECRCNHLTSFASAFFVPPVAVDFSDPGFGDVNKNPTVFAAFIVVMCMYTIVVIWARKADKIDCMKVELILDWST